MAGEPMCERSAASHVFTSGKPGNLDSLSHLRDSLTQAVCERIFAFEPAALAAANLEDFSIADHRAVGDSARCNYNLGDVVRGGEPPDVPLMLGDVPRHPRLSQCNERQAEGMLLPSQVS